MDIIPKEDVKTSIPPKKVFLFNSISKNNKNIKNVSSEGYFGNLNNQFLREF